MFPTSMAFIRDRVVLEMTPTKGVPKAPWISFKSLIVGFKDVMISFMRVSAIVISGGILEGD
jgi:hypothetical protein